MFRTASEIDRSMTAGKLRGSVQNWFATANSWFDGTPASVDRRLVECRSMLSVLHGATGRFRVADAGDYLELTSTLEASRRTLEEFRDDLLSGRLVAQTPQRTASREVVVLGSTDEARFVELESQSFLAREAGTYGDDIEELTVRAANHVTAATSTWEVGSARRVQVAFVDRVREMGSLAARGQHTATKRLAAYQDFDDSLLMLD